MHPAAPWVYVRRRTVTIVREARALIDIAEHTGELEMRIAHATLAGLYTEAGRGLVREMADPREPAGTRRIPIALDSSGPDTLLSDLLNEVVFLAEIQSFLPHALEVEEVGDGRPSASRGPSYAGSGKSAESRCGADRTRGSPRRPPSPTKTSTAWWAWCTGPASRGRWHGWCRSEW